MKVSLFCLGKEPLETDREYVIKLETRKSAVRLSKSSA
jgi:sulfate adenylyltransferase subunit 1 (EFTu-like GTPase family)